MEKPYKYDEWLESTKVDGNSDLHILSTYFSVVQQHLNDPKNLTGKQILIHASRYVEYYLHEKESNDITESELYE